MDRVHDAIEWYQKKIGSYDKQLWEQSVERKLRKQPEFILQNAPRRQVRLKTEYIDVDLIRGSTFTKTKPQVPWVYVTKKAVARILFFPFYYNWWIHQTSRWGYAGLLCLYVMQVTSICVFVSSDDGLLEDELSFTEVILPIILMFLLCLIHSQTVLAHITHKPPKHKAISGVTRKPKPKPKKSTRKSRNSGSNSTCAEDGGQQNSARQERQQDLIFPTVQEGQSNHVSVEKISKSFESSTTVQEDVLLLQSCRKTENNTHCNGLAQRLSQHSTDGSQLPLTSSLPRLQVTRAVRNLNDLGKGEEIDSLRNNQRVHLRTISEKSDSSLVAEKELVSDTESKMFHDETKAETNGGECLSGSASIRPESAAASPTVSWSGSSGCSNTLLGNLPRSRSDNQGSRSGDRGSRSGGTEGSKRTGPGSVSDGGPMGTHDDELETDQTCVTDLPLEEPESFHHTSLSISSLEEGFFKNGDVCHGKRNALWETGRDLQASEACACCKQSTSVHTAHSGAAHAFQGSRSEGDINGRSQCFKGKPDSYIEMKLSDSGHVSCNSHSCGAATENDFSFANSSTNIHKNFTPKQNVTELNDAKQNRSQGTHDLKSSDDNLKSKEFSTDVKKTYKILSAAVENWDDELLSKVSNLMLSNKVPINGHEHHLVEDAGKQSTVPGRFHSDSESVQQFAHYLVEKIISSETLLMKIFHSAQSISDSRLQHHPRHNVAQCRSFSEFRASFPPSSAPLTSLLTNHKNKDNNVHLSAAEAVKSNTAQLWSQHSKLSNSPSSTSCLNKLHHLQRVKDTPEESNLSDEDEDDNNVKELDVDADVDDDGEDEDGVMSDFFGNKSVEGSDSDYELDRPARMKQLRFQRGLLDGKANDMEDLQQKLNAAMSGPTTSISPQSQQQQKPQLRCRRRKSGSAITASVDETDGVFIASAKSAEVLAGEASIIKNTPKSLGLRVPYEKTLKNHHGDKHVSSSENEGVGAQTPEGSHKAAVSSEEWEDRIQTDDTTSSAYSSSVGDSAAESEEGKSRTRSLDDDGEERTEYTTSTLHVINLLQPGGSPNNSAGNVSQSDRVSCLIWEGNECKKVDLTALDIGWAIIDKVDSLPESSDYFLIGLLFSVIISMIPLIFRAWMNKGSFPWNDLVTVSGLLSKVVEVPSLVAAVYTWRQWLLLLNSVLQRFFLSLIFFFLLSVADRTFKQRLLYAKHFSYLTSSRRARKFTMPHFRLSKVRNIKIWLSLRSYLKRRGPQRSVDVIVSACFMCAICTVSLISLQMLKDSDNYLGYLCNWELLIWCGGLAIFLMRFMTVGLKINKKYRNLSVLITEQINLYLQMEQKPHKKDELILANNVLRLAEDLLKELESPFKISGFSANPVVYNVMRVVVLSAFSAVLTEVLGFKLKLYKIKLKA
ncbi:hypothetical protein EGW08_022137 [Elysia chlorotica]|uniref:PHTF1/2 N-terminal domain-containing protein n=1 Tax=Elysia chlorotica TaxID=188477 RepID=A0A3S1ARK3_ELYCH|nr:hypothetical protein EGW08_022137 [Elysia chlorotica]